MTIAARVAPPAKALASSEETAPPDLGSGVRRAAPTDQPGAAIAGILPGVKTSLPAPPPAAEPSEPVRVGGKVKEPRLISRVLPIYPSSARRMGLEGDVIIDAVIDPAGNVKTAKTISGPALLQRAALEAVRKWKYAPSRLDDQPISIQMLVTLQFRLH